MNNTVKAANGADVYTHDLYAAIDDYIAEHDDIDLVNDMTQYQWKDVLVYLHKKVIGSRSNLKREDRENNAYDLDLLDHIYRVYRELCYKYNKITMLADFAILTGIEDNVFTAWSNENGRAFNVSASHLHKKIMADNESGISSMMISSGRNPVGYMAILNHYHGWNTQNDNSDIIKPRRTLEEIGAAHGIEINNTKKLPPATFIDGVADYEE